MKIANDTNDRAVLLEFGRRIKRTRIDLGLSQEELADKAGLSAMTVSRIEEGKPGNTLTLIRILRVFEDLANLELLLPSAEERAGDYLRDNRTAPQRVGRKKKKSEEAGNWKWGDEE